MSITPPKSYNREQDFKTPKKNNSSKAKTSKSKVLKAFENLKYYDNTAGSSTATNSGSEESVEILVEDPDEENVYKTRRRSSRVVSTDKRHGNTAASSTATNSDSEGLVEIIVEDPDEKSAAFTHRTRRRSSRKVSPNKRYTSDFVLDSGGGATSTRKRNIHKNEVTDEESKEENTDVDFVVDTVDKPKAGDLKLLEEDVEMAGKLMFSFNTPKKKGGMTLAVLNTPKTPLTPKTPKTPKTPGRLGKTPDAKRSRKSLDPRTPSHQRNKLKTEIAKLVETNSDSDFSADDSDFAPSEDESSSSDNDTSEPDNEADDEPKTPYKGRKPILVPILPKTPSAARAKQSTRVKKNSDFVPECESYFQSHSSSKILTSDHTLDRLKNPRLPADRLFSLLAEMKLSQEHEDSINAMMEEYQSYFPKWMYILNEGYNILLYGLGSKRQLLQSFHRTVLSQQTVLVVNGFFPSLTIKEILDSITNDILDAGVSASNPHEAVDMIEEEFALIPQTHLYLIVHNLEGPMLRNSKAQSILARLAKVPNIHMLASVDHINTPLLWDHTKLGHFNFSWWDCTTMLPYSDETAFENSLMVQNSGELALSSMRSVFLSLTTNSRGIYMIIVKHQLQNKGNQNYQGMHFKDLYGSCREAFLVSSDLALRAQLTEFLDHKLVKSKRSVDGSELLTIPIDAVLLQQFLDEQEKKL